MKRPSVKAFVCLASFVSLLSSIARSGGLDDISQSVVFLRDTLPVLENVNGTNMEVWLKLPEANSFMRKTQVVGGTGFVIVSSNIPYLITAKHVAQQMSERCEILMRGKGNEPWSFRLIFKRLYYF